MLARLSIAKRLLVGLGLLTVLIAGLTGYAIVSGNQVGAAFELAQRASDNQTKVVSVLRHLYETRFNMWVYFGTTQTERHVRAVQLADLLKSDIDGLASTTFDPEPRALVEELGKLVGDYRELVIGLRRIYEQTHSFDSPEAMQSKQSAGKASARIDEI